jgi:hypothetical protein
MAFETFKRPQSPAHPNVVDLDDEADDGYAPPVAVRVEAGSVVRSDCPACGKPMKKHSSLELLRCAASQDDDDDDDEEAEEAAPPPSSDYDEWLAARQPDANGEVRAAPAQRPLVADPDPTVAPAITADAVRRSEAAGLPNIIPLPEGGIDYEALAGAMRVVIERERDEVVKRGGPLEKQNQELKMRIADLLEELAVLRRRHQSAVEERNTYKDQLDEQIKANRKLRNQQAGNRNGERTKVNEINDILRICRKTPGVEVKMGGNGHWQIYKDGVFVSDAASSGGSQKVNMATVVKLRKVGIDV